MGEKLFVYGVVLFVLGILLLIYQLNKAIRRIRYRDTGDPQSVPPGGPKAYIIVFAVLVIIIAQMFFWLSPEIKHFRPFNEGGLFAYLYIARTGDPVKSLEMRYSPMTPDSTGTENRFYLSGDSWRISGEVLKFKFLNGFLGLPDSCYKVAEFSSMFVGRLPPDTRGPILHRELIDGGATDAYKYFRDTRLFKWFAEADSFASDYNRVDNTVGFYMYIESDGSVALR